MTSGELLSAAITACIRNGKALLKFISANDVGKTGSHQYGVYIPKGAASLLTPHPANRGENNDHEVKIVWQGIHDEVTESCIKWYGKAKSEYRLTRFQKGFKWLNKESVGSLLVIVPLSMTNFEAFVLDHDEEIDEICAALGVEFVDVWAVYDSKKPVDFEQNCLGREMSEIVGQIDNFPDTSELSSLARKIALKCIEGWDKLNPDKELMKAIEIEYSLFKQIEWHICASDVKGPFSSIDKFIEVAATIMNRRKARAGRSLENHFDELLTRYSIPHSMRAHVDGQPDILIPGVREYMDADYPESKLTMIALKTTCKDRWRQVLQEANRIDRKHLVTLQNGISDKQVTKMTDSGVILVVPKKHHTMFSSRSRKMILTVEGFIEDLRQKYVV